MKFQMHIFGWVFILIVSIFAVAVVVPPEKIMAGIQHDTSSIYASFGEEAGTRIVQSAQSHYQAFFGDGQVLNKMQVTEAQKNTGLFGWERKATNITNGFVEALKLSIYQTLLRLSVIAAWMPMLALIMIVAVVDGLVSRKIKHTTFANPDPARYNAMGHLAILIIGVSVFMTHLPLTISPFFWPIAGVCLAVTVLIGLANLQSFQQS